MNNKAAYTKLLRLRAGWSRRYVEELLLWSRGTLYEIERGTKEAPEGYNDWLRDMAKHAAQQAKERGLCR